MQINENKLKKAIITKSIKVITKICGATRTKSLKIISDIATRTKSFDIERKTTSINSFITKTQKNEKKKKSK